MYRLSAIAVFAASLAACATVPTPLRGDYPALTPRDPGAQGQSVRWGGEIIRVEPKADTTCFEILARALDAATRPIRRDTSQGRFVACHPGFYDPEDYERGREVTVVGRVTGTDHGKVGEFDYAYPHVDATDIHLWPKRVPHTPYYDPWMYGFGPGWYGPGWGPYWGAPPIIIRERPHRPHPETPAPRR